MELRTQITYKKIKRGPALRAYCRYLIDISRRGNWQEIVVALNPCLMGYVYAVDKVKDKITAAEGSIYSEWCDTCTSSFCYQAVLERERLMNHILETYPPDQLDSLVTIFARGCELETNFWTAAMEYE